MNADSLLLAITPIVALTLNVMTQILSMHLIKRISSSILLGSFAGFACTLVVSNNLATLQHYSEDMFINLFTYFCFAICFWAFLNLNITSLRIRIIRELLNKKSMSTELLLKQYSGKELMMRRLERLEKGGQIKRYNNRWVLNSRKLLFFIYISEFLRYLIFATKQHDQ